jgi:hypothetical protein
MLDIYANNQAKEKSSYQPSKAVTERTLIDKKAYQTGYDIQRRSYPEFNGMSVLQRQDMGQQIFNLYEEPEPSDPDKKWRSRSVRAGARNNVISVAAHLISAMMYPNFTAQNDTQDEDQDAGHVMRDMILFNIENSDYEMSMLFGVIAACVNPCMYMSVDYAEAMQKLRGEYESKDKGMKEVVDEVLSGMSVEPERMQDYLISNIYQYHHQKQPCRIKRLYISKDEFDAKFSDHKNHRYVSAGVQALYSETDKCFYDVDETAKNENLVEWVNIQYRRHDFEVSYVNGVYFGDKDVEKNPMKHRRLTYDRATKEPVSVPFYPEAKTGYEPIDEKKFYYYRTAIDKLLPDHKRLQKMARLAEDATVLAVLKPVLQSGRAKINQSVVFPAGVTSLPEGSKVDFLDIGANISALYENMREAEKEMGASVTDKIRQGAVSEKTQTAYELSRIEANAIIKEFAIFGRMIGRMVEDIGALMADCIIHHQTTLDYEEVTGGMFRLKEHKFLLNNQSKDGRKVTKKLVFTDEYMGANLTPDQMLEESWKVYEEQEEQGGNVEIFKINPYIFSRLRYFAKCDVDTMMPKSMAFEEDRKLRAYQLMIVDPFGDKEAIARDFLYDPLTDGKADKYMRKSVDLGLMPGMDPMNPTAPQGSQKQNISTPVPAIPEQAGVL